MRAVYINKNLSVDILNDKLKILSQVLFNLSIISAICMLVFSCLLRCLLFPMLMEILFLIGMWSVFLYKIENVRKQIRRTRKLPSGELRAEICLLNEKNCVPAVLVEGICYACNSGVKSHNDTILIDCVTGTARLPRRLKWDVMDI